MSDFLHLGFHSDISSSIISNNLINRFLFMNHSDTLDLSLQLLRQPSVPPVDHNCQTIMAERLAAIGFNIENMRFEDVDNLWARRGTSSPVFCFAGHTDVVPTGHSDARESDQFLPAIRVGKL